jgi:hypothetical protein
MQNNWRFVLKYGSTSVDVNPMCDNVSFEWEYDEDRRHYRMKMDGTLTFINKRGYFYDFDVIVNNGYNDDCLEFQLSAYRWCDSVNPFWTGRFVFPMCAVDYDRCQLKVMPDILDEYTPFYDNLDVAYNIIGEHANQLLTFYECEIPAIEVMLQYEDCARTNFDFFGTNIADVNAPPYVIPTFADSEYALQVNPGDTPGWHFWKGVCTGITLLSNFQYVAYYEYAQCRRWYCVTPDQGGVPLNPDNSIFVEGPAIDINGVPYHKFILTNFTFVEQSFQYKCLFDAGSLSSSRFEYWDIANKAFYAGAARKLQVCRLLKDVITRIAAANDLDYLSIFFDDPVNPVDGVDHNGKNYLNNLLVIPVYDYINYSSTSQYVFDFKLSFNDLFEELKNMFNVGWHIENGTLRIEHYSYYDNGMSYTPNAPQLDLTTEYPDYLAYTNSYEVEPQPKRAEKFTWSFQFWPEWVGEPITYSCIGREIEEYFNEIFITDLFAVRANSDVDETRSNLVMLCVDPDYPYSFPEGFRLFDNPHNGVNRPNSPLSRVALLEDFWRHGRQSFKGNMNGEPHTFASIIRSKKQTAITVPLCCDEIQPFWSVRSGLGVGLMDGLKYDLKDNTITFNLKLE